MTINVGYYVTRLQSNQKFWLAGPFDCQEQAEAKLPAMTNVDVSDCPGDHIQTKKHNVGNGFMMISKDASRGNLRSSWLGKATPKLISKDLFD